MLKFLDQLLIFNISKKGNYLSRDKYISLFYLKSDYLNFKCETSFYTDPFILFNFSILSDFKNNNETNFDSQGKDKIKLLHFRMYLNLYFWNFKTKTKD